MRVIAGSARGRKLHTLAGEDVRPTPDRVKEALFNMLQFQMEGRRVLDLFAGSGQLGIEALSRGAAQAVFVEKSRAAAAVVEQNLAASGFSDRGRVLHMDYTAALLQSGGPFDVAFLDPPYRSGLLQRALPAAAEHMNRGGVLVAEHPLDETPPEKAGDFFRERTSRYGTVCLTLYRHKE